MEERNGQPHQQHGPDVRHLSQLLHANRIQAQMIRPQPDWQRALHNSYYELMRVRILLLLTALCAVQLCQRKTGLPIKVVVVTMFERGADTGDQPGELQYWVEREKLDRVIPFPQGYHDLRMNNDGVLAVLTGVGTAKAASTIMALGMDPRFDLSKAYWIVAGIAGIDPADGSLGSAAWAEWVVDGDIGYEIDAREIPKDWKTGFVPLRKSVPYELPLMVPNNGEAYHLNAALVDWAFRLTQNVPLMDSEAMQKERALYPSANAQRPPVCAEGRHAFIEHVLARQVDGRVGEIDWVKYHTGGQGQLRHNRHGRHRHFAVADVSFERREGRCEPRVGSAHGERLRFAHGIDDGGREPGAQ